jgi:hypothetical protein
VKIPDAQSPGPSASLVGTEETLEKVERDPDAPEPAAEIYLHGILLNSSD